MEINIELKINTKENNILQDALEIYRNYLIEQMETISNRDVRQTVDSMYEKLSQY